MIDSILAGIFTTQWRVLVIVVALLLVSAEIGYWFGLRIHRAHDEQRKGLVGGTRGAVLGLLGLLLGFTFAFAVSRYEGRRELVIQEANAIGTAFLRASFLPPAHRAEVENLLRRYVDVRLQFHDARVDSPEHVTLQQTTAALQRELWAQAVASGEERPTPLVNLFVASLNEAIDIDTMRLNAARSHVPGPVWLLLLAVAVCGCWTSGYQEGANGVRSLITHVVLPLLVTVVITLIADLDRPRQGLIGISVQPLLDVEAAMDRAP